MQPTARRDFGQDEELVRNPSAVAPTRYESVGLWRSNCRDDPAGTCPARDVAESVVPSAPT